jgi:hypothetical protein
MEEELAVELEAWKGNKLALRVLQELALAEEGRSDFDFNGQSLLEAGQASTPS